MIRANRAERAAGVVGKKSERLGRLADKLATLAARRVRPAAGFLSRPEPRSMGDYARGKELVAGTVFLAGHILEAPDTALWDIPAPEAAFTEAAHGFAWLDDLAALGTPAARRRAQDWTWGWIARFGKVQGPGWVPDLTGRRMIRWTHHATWLLSGRHEGDSEAFFQALAAQGVYLAHRWQAAAPGLPQFEALTGLVYAGQSLIGMQRVVGPASAALSQLCEAEIDAEGGIPSRSPEDLLEVLTHLTWAASAMSEAGHPVPSALAAAITRIAPALRSLRHADGDLARFHGGGKGAEGRLDQALAAAGPRPKATPATAMGFVRMAGRRTSLIVDAASPPMGQAALTAHASTTAFELTSGRRALVVNCGSGESFGPAWRRAARATRSHSALCLDGASSSRFGVVGSTLEQRASVTTSRLTQGSAESELSLAHDGWLASHGLMASRNLTLAQDGRSLAGVDALIAPTDEARRRFEDVMTATAKTGAGFTIRFHLHPEVEAALDEADTGVSLALRSGEVWVFRYSGTASLVLEPSAYLEKGQVLPRPCTQIVLRAQARTFETRIGWTLAKAKDTPLAIRDLERADPDGQG